MWWITCPDCGNKAPLGDYEPSCADECTCPKCGCFFQWEAPEDEDDIDVAPGEGDGTGEG